MAADLAIVGIGMDTSQVKAGEQAVVRSFANIGDAATKMNRYLEERARLEKVAAQAAQERARVDDLIANGQKVKASEFFRIQQAERQAIEQLTAARRAAWAQGGPLFQAEAAAYAENASRAKVAAAAKREADQASRRLSSAMQVLTTASLGIPGPLGRITSSLGALALGGGVTIGVLAAFAALGAAYNAFTEDARKAREENDKLNASLAASAEARFQREQPVAYARQQLENITRQQEDLRAEAARLQRVTQQIDPNTGLVPTLDVRRLAEINAEIVALGKSTNEIVLRANEQVTANERISERAARSAESAAERARRLAEERLRQVEDLAAAEAAAVTANARLAQDAAKEEQARQAAARLELEQRIRAMDRLTTAERERFRVAGEALIAAEAADRTQRAAEKEAQERERLAREERQRLEERGRQLATLARAEADANVQRAKASGDLAAQEAAERQAAIVAIDEQVRRMTELTDVERERLRIALLNADAEERAAKAAEAAAAAAQRKRDQEQAAFFNLFNYAGQFTAGDPVGGTLFGGIGGAASGFLAAGPLGAVVGGVTGLVDGLLGAGGQAEAAARRMEEARIAFARSLDDFVAAAEGTQTRLQAAVEGIQEYADDLRRNLDAQYGPFRGLPGYGRKLDTINQAEQDNIARAEREAARERQYLGEDFAVRGLRAQGLDAEADAMALRITQEREWLDLQEELGAKFDENLQRQVRQVHELEREAAARRAAEEAARREAERLERQTRLNEDLEVRLLRAQGEGDAADALQRRIAFEREYAQAVKDGMDAATLAMIENVYAAEELAIAQAKAADEAQRLIDAINAEVRATENLTVRHLRATGATYAADEAAQLFQQQEERRRAIEEGRSQEYLAYLDQVHAEERAAADRARQQAQQAAFDDAVRSAFPPDATFLPDSRTSVNLAVGVSESTAGQMTGLMRSQLAYLSALPAIRGDTDQMVALLRVIANAIGGGALVSLVDEGLAQVGASTNAANGVPPGNT